MGFIYLHVGIHYWILFFLSSLPTHCTICCRLNVDKVAEMDAMKKSMFEKLNWVQIGFHFNKFDVASNGRFDRSGILHTLQYFNEMGAELERVNIH